MRVLVTGGGGFLGGAIVRQLVAAGHGVRTVARGDYPALAALGVEHQRGDLSEAGVASRAVEGVDVVVHVAAKTGVWGKRADFVAANVDATRRLLDAVAAAGVDRLVYTSSPSVIFDGHDHLDADGSLPYPQRYLAHYPETKALAEREVLGANSATLATVALRPHLIWGPGDPWLLPRVIARHRAGRLRILGDGTNRVSLTFVENAAAAHLQALHALAPGVEWAGRPYFVNDPDPVVLWEWLNALFRRLGLPPCERRVSHGFAHAAGTVAEVVWTLLGLVDDPPMTRFVAAQLATSHTYTLAPARAAFGYTPVVDAAEGFERTVRAFGGDPGGAPA